MWLTQLHQNRSDADVASLPYADTKTKTVKGDEIPTVANALMTKANCQYQKEYRTQQTVRGIRRLGPSLLAGTITSAFLAGEYTHAADRVIFGHALIGNLDGFDAPMTNPKYRGSNSLGHNQARDSFSTGQNYYETLACSEGLR